MQTLQKKNGDIRNELILVFSASTSEMAGKSRKWIWIGVILALIALSLGLGLGFGLNGDSAEEEIFDESNPTIVKNRRQK